MVAKLPESPIRDLPNMRTRRLHVAFSPVGARASKWPQKVSGSNFVSMVVQKFASAIGRRRTIQMMVQEFIDATKVSHRTQMMEQKFRDASEASKTTTML